MSAVLNSVPLGDAASLRPVHALSLRHENLWSESREQSAGSTPPVPLPASPLGSLRWRSSVEPGPVQSSGVWLRTQQVVCDGRPEPTSEPPQRGGEEEEQEQRDKTGQERGSERREKSERQSERQSERRSERRSVCGVRGCQGEDGSGDSEVVGGCEQGGRDKSSAACLQTNSLCALLW